MYVNLFKTRLEYDSNHKTIMRPPLILLTNVPYVVAFTKLDKSFLMEFVVGCDSWCNPEV